jgi:hypothetical protein
MRGHADVNLSMPVLSFLTDEGLVRLMVVLTIGLAVAAVVVPRFVARAGASAAAARLSPLWVVAPTVLCVGVLTLVDPHTKDVTLLIVAALCLVQLALSALVIYRHRRWPWIALPFALMPPIWWAIFVAMIALAGLGP